MFNVLVTPYVGIISHNFTPKPTPNEVAEVFRAPLSFFLQDSRDHSVIEREMGGELRRSHMFLFEGRRIWGLTCEFLIHFLVEAKVGKLPFMWNYENQVTWFDRSLMTKPETSKL